MENIKKHFKEYWLFYLITVLAVGLFCFVIYPISSLRPIDYDNSYQAALMEHSLKEIWELIPTDYSPPLYAFYLKIFEMFFGSDQAGLRVSEVVIYLGMLPVCFFPLRRAFGKKVAAFTSVCFLFTSANHWIFMAFRPHVLGYFLTTIAFVYAVLVYKTGSKRDYVCLTLFSVLAMYSHTYAMLSALGFYIALLVAFGIKKNFKSIKYVFVSGIICSVCYAPWLFVLYSQFRNVQNHYWSNLIDFKSMFNALFLFHFDNFSKNSIADIALTVFLALHIFCGITIKLAGSDM